MSSSRMPGASGPLDNQGPELGRCLAAPLPGAISGAGLDDFRRTEDISARIERLDGDERNGAAHRNLGLEPGTVGGADLGQVGLALTAQHAPTRDLGGAVP